MIIVVNNNAYRTDNDVVHGKEIRNIVMIPDTDDIWMVNGKNGDIRVEDNTQILGTVTNPYPEFYTASKIING